MCKVVIIWPKNRFQNFSPCAFSLSLSYLEMFAYPVWWYEIYAAASSTRTTCSEHCNLERREKRCRCMKKGNEGTEEEQSESERESPSICPFIAPFSSSCGCRVLSFARRPASVWCDAPHTQLTVLMHVILTMCDDDDERDGVCMWARLSFRRGTTYRTWILMWWDIFACLWKIQFDFTVRQSFCLRIDDQHVHITAVPTLSLVHVSIN